MRAAERGLTLVEVVVAIAMFGIIMGFALPALLGNVRISQRTQQRNDAVAVAQITLEALRRSNVTSLPTATNASDSSVVSYNGRPYNVKKVYCATPAYCVGSARHVTVEVRNDASSLLYSAQTVFTSLQ